MYSIGVDTNCSQRGAGRGVFKSGKDSEVKGWRISVVSGTFTVRYTPYYPSSTDYTGVLLWHEQP